MPGTAETLAHIIALILSIKAGISKLAHIWSFNFFYCQEAARTTFSKAEQSPRIKAVCNLKNLWQYLKQAQSDSS